MERLDADPRTRTPESVLYKDVLDRGGPQERMLVQSLTNLALVWL